MPDKARDAFGQPPPAGAHGDGDPKRGGYGAGGLSSGAERTHGAVPNTWDAPGITPDGHRTGSPMDGPRTATGEESEPRAEPEG